MENEFIYSGSWNILEHGDTSYHGKLHYSREERALYLELEIPEDWNTDGPDGVMPQFKKNRYKQIQGVLFNGAHILLYDCALGSRNTYLFQFTRVVIYAKYAFWGLQEETPLLFKEAQFDFGEIIEWSGLCHFKDTFDSEKPGYLWEHEPPVSFELNANVKVTLSPVMGGWSSESVYRTKSEISQHIVVELSYIEDVPWETAIDDAQAVRYLVGLGVNRLPRIESIKHIHRQMESVIPGKNGTVSGNDDDVFYPAHEVFVGTGKDSLSQDYRQNERLRYWFTLPQMQEAAGLERWSSNYPKLKPVLDLYFSTETLSTDAAFLSMMQALETFHARFYADKLSDYRNKIAQYEGYGVWWPLLFSDDQKDHKGIILKSRISSLMFADGAVPFLPGMYSHEDYIQKLVDTRNYFTHYDVSKESLIFSDEELPFVNAELECLLKYHLFVLLGFDKKKVRDKVVQRMNEIETNYQLWVR